MLGNILSLALPLTFQICRGGLGNKGRIKKLACRQAVDGFHGTLPAKDYWITKSADSLTHQDGNNSQHDAAHVILQFSVGQCSVQAVERVPGSQLQQNKHT